MMWDVIKILKIIFKHKILVIRSMVAILGVTFCLLSIGTSIKSLINKGIDSGDVMLLDQSALQIILLLCAFSFFSFIRSNTVSKLSNQIIYDIRQKAYSNLLMLKINYFEETSPAKLQLYILDYVQSFTAIIQEIFSFFIRNIIILVSSIILMYYQSSVLFFTSIISVILVCLPVLLLIKKIKNTNSEQKKFIDKIAEIINQTAQNIKLIYAHNLQDFSRNNFDKTSLNLQIAMNQSNTSRSLLFSVMSLIICVAITLIIWAGGRQILSAELSSGALVAFIIYSVMAISSLIGIFNNLSETKPHFEKLQTIFELIENNNYEQQQFSVNILPKNLDIAFEDICFSYLSREKMPVLVNFDAQIKSTQFVSISGKSGIGKSTIAYLLLKFYQPTKGKITLGGINIKELNTNIIRKNIGFSNQDPLMFNASILENITLGKSYSAKHLDNILQMCVLDTMLNNMPDGLHTIVGIKADKLSNGQKQRISIARSLITSPSILILDEATNSLDEEAELMILNRIKNYMQDKTIIFISHNPKIIHSADKIINLDQLLI